MKWFVTVKPNSKNNDVQAVDQTHLRVSVKAPSRDGKANEAVIRVLSEYFHIPKTRISILRGETSRQKVIEIS